MMLQTGDSMAMMSFFPYFCLDYRVNLQPRIQTVRFPCVRGISDYRVYDK